MQCRLQREYFDNWQEKCHVTEYVGYSSQTIYRIIYDLSPHFGLEKAERVRAVLFSDDFHDEKLYNFLFEDSEGTVKFGMVAINKNGDSINAVSCIYVLNFSMGYERITDITTQKVFGVSFTSKKRRRQRGELSFANKESLQNFCALKALKEFQRRRIVSKINMTN